MGGGDCPLSGIETFQHTGFDALGYKVFCRRKKKVIRKEKHRKILIRMFYCIIAFRYDGGEEDTKCLN